MGRFGGKNGAVAFITGINANFNKWRLAFTHPVDDTSAYDDTVSGASHGGSGTVDYNLTASGVLASNVASSAPGFGGTSAPVASIAGATVTLTANTGCTEAATFIPTGGSIDHGKRQGSTPISLDAVASGAMTETWAVS